VSAERRREPRVIVTVFGEIACDPPDTSRIFMTKTL